MADNQYVNKVDWNGGTLIDLTTDDVSRADVALGKTFHLPSGEQTTGTASGGGAYNVTSIIDSDDKQHIYIEDAGASRVQAKKIEFHKAEAFGEYVTVFYSTGRYSDGLMARHQIIDYGTMNFGIQESVVYQPVYVMFDDNSFFTSHNFTAGDGVLVERVDNSGYYEKGYLKIIVTEAGGYYDRVIITITDI